MITIGCVGCVLVWASQCLAYIRYFNWLRTHKPDLNQLKEEDPRTYNRYDRDNMNRRERFHTLLGPTQPAPAYLGLLMCLLTVFVFSTATWWRQAATAKKVAVAYTGVYTDSFLSAAHLLTCHSQSPVSSSGSRLRAGDTEKKGGSCCGRICLATLDDFKRSSTVTKASSISVMKTKTTFAADVPVPLRSLKMATGQVSQVNRRW